MPISPRTALERAVDLALLAPSVHNTQPWLLELRSDRLLLRADRSRQLTAMDPTGRKLVRSVGAALFDARVALAADGWGADVGRLPDPADPDLLAVVRPVAGEPDRELAALAPAVPRRGTDRRASPEGQVPDDVLRGLTAGAAAEGAVLVPVLRETHRRLVARLTQQADRVQNADADHRAEPRHGEADMDSGPDSTLVLLATRSDEPLAWLESGEAMQRVLRELTALGWSAGPLTRAVEVPVTRMQLRSALTWDAHPQLLLRIGHAGTTPPTPRRPRADVVLAG
jgi:nitroreductase